MDRPENDELIVREISGCQRRLFLYLSGLLCSSDLAEDALQETNLVLWRKRNQFQPGTNFFAWACKIAFYEARKARQSQHRHVPAFSDVFLDQVGPELVAAVALPNSLQDLLDECKKELAECDRDLIERRYADGATTQSVAVEVGRSPDTVYKSLSRIHQRLFDCVNAKLEEDEKR